MAQNWLSAEERAEYDELLIEAGFTPDGMRRPTNEIGSLMARLLADAVQGGRFWAGYVQTEDAEYACR